MLWTVAALAALLVALPLAISVSRGKAHDGPWDEAPRHSAGLAPDPAIATEAIVQVYTARAFSWRGYVAIHPWIIFKREGAPAFTRLEVVGWGGGTVVRRDYGLPDGLWYGAMPELVADYRGPGVGAMIGQIEAAAAGYPFAGIYRTWPGPNSNTFLAHVARSVPLMRLDLPATAIGKDFRPWSRPLGRAPSGTGLQVSLLGLAGVTVALEEGIEVNVLGVGFGLDVLRPALRVPGLGRIGLRAPVARRVASD